MDAIVDALGCSRFDDIGTGGNSGLRAFGTCFLGDANVDIYLTSDGSWDHIVGTFPTVSGPGWIVVCTRGEDDARLVQSLIGGRFTPEA